MAVFTTASCTILNLVGFVVVVCFVFPVPHALESESFLHLGYFI